MLETILYLDKYLFLIINNSLANSFNDLLLGGLTWAGNLVILLPITAIYLYLLDKKSFRKNFIILVLAVLLGGIIVRLLKEAVGRPRPMKEMEVLLLTGEVKIHSLFYPYKANSFPSGHTQAAFGTATALICVTKKHMFYLISIAFLIGLSRIYVGVHFPLDVVSGAIIGALVSILVFRISVKSLK